MDFDNFYKYLDQICINVTQKYIVKITYTTAQVIFNCIKEFPNLIRTSCSLIIDLVRTF